QRLTHDATGEGGGQRAHLAAQRGDRVQALGLDLRVRVLDYACGLGLRLLADAGGLVPGVAELLLELGQLGVGLGLLGLGRLQAALDGGRPVGEGLLEVRYDELLDSEEQQSEDDQRQDDLDPLDGERARLVASLSCGEDPVHGGGPSSVTWCGGQSTNARAIPMMASASARAKPRIAIDWRRLCASG